MTKELKTKEVSDSCLESLLRSESIYATATKALNTQIEITQSLQSKLKQAEEALEEIERISCGEDQVAEDDSEGMGVIYKKSTAALAELKK